VAFVVAHRGASAYAPENTLKAIEKAIAQGADFIEIDIKLSKDGYIVLMHDSTVNRTTSGQGNVGDLTLSRLKEFDAGEGERIPLLDDVFKFINPQIGLMLDLADSGFEELLVEKICKFDLVDKVIVSGAHSPLSKIKNLHSKIKIAPSFNKLQSNLIEKALSLKAEIFNCYYNILTKELVKEAHKYGMMVTAWVVNKEEDIKRMIKFEVDGITTDKPDVVRRLLPH